MDDLIRFAIQGHWLGALIVLLVVAGILGAIGFIVGLIRGKNPLRMALDCILKGL